MYVLTKGHEQPIQNHIFWQLRYELKYSMVSSLYEWFNYYEGTELPYIFALCISLFFILKTFLHIYVKDHKDFPHYILIKLSKYFIDLGKKCKVEQYLDVLQSFESLFRDSSIQNPIFSKCLFEFFLKRLTFLFIYVWINWNLPCQRNSSINSYS